LGLFWKKTSSTAALSVILLTIPISVLFKYFIPELGFLNRMSLTFIALLLIALILSIKNKTIEKSLQILSRNDISFKTSIIFNIGSLIIISLTTVFYIVFS
jgi:SSS family solute:Na+ symporter